MAFHIRITKIHRDESITRYSFEGDQCRKGVFELDMQTNKITLIEPMPGDDKGHCFDRAAIKIMRAWRDGNLPEVTEWAS